MKLTKGTSLILAAAIATGGLSATAASAAPLDTSARDSVKSQNHSWTGSRVTFCASIDPYAAEKLYVGGRQVARNMSVVVKGKNGDGDDVSVHFKTNTKDGPNFYAHNPSGSEAYLQVGDHKVYDQQFVEKDGMYFGVRFVGTEGGYKRWIVRCYGTKYPWAQTFIHRERESDGIKGELRNEGWAPITVIYSKYEKYTIKPGETFLFIDANPDLESPFGNGVQIELRNEHNQSYLIEISDPPVGYPSAFVKSQQGKTSPHLFDVGEKVTYTDRNYPGRFFVQRQRDQTAWAGETEETADWGAFQLTIAL